MPTRDGLISSRILTTDATQIVGGSIVSTDLVLTRKSGATVNVGAVKGATGASGVTPVFYSTASAAVTVLTTAVTASVGSWTFVEGTSGLFTPSGTDFIATQAGTYHIIFSVTVSSSTVGRRIALIYVNGVDKRRVECSSAGPWTGLVETTLFLSVGNTLSLRVYQSSGANLALSAGPGHDLTVIKLS